MLRLCPVLHRLLPGGNGEVLCARVQVVLHNHLMFAVLPSVQVLLYPPSDGVGCGDMLVSLQYHRLEDDELLQVPRSVPYALKLSPERPDTLSPNFPALRIIAPQCHDSEVMTPRLP